MNKFEDVFTKIINLSTEELCEVYYNLNGYRWDDRIGEKPEGFDDLPTWRNKWYHRFTRKTTKRDYVEPMLMIVKDTLPEKDYSHWLNVKKYKLMTNEQFERFWRAQQQNHRSSSIW